MAIISSEKQLIEKSIRGDQEAQRQLLKSYMKYAFSIALKIVKNREDAEEVAQDSFVKAFKALRNFNEVGKFSTWLYKIVFNTALTRIRNKKVVMDSLEYVADVHAELEFPDNYPGAFENLVQADQTTMLNKAFSVLTESESLVITLFYTCENTIAEIESITKWNPSTVKIRLFRARQKLYKELSRLLNHEINDLL